jgi:hypothetical protein
MEYVVLSGGTISSDPMGWLQTNWIYVGGALLGVVVLLSVVLKK